MSFWDDIADVGRVALPVIGTVGGAVAGSFVGAPMAGAMIGGGLGSAGASLLPHDDSGVNKALADRKALWDKLSYVGPQPGQGLTPADMAAFRAAEQRAGQFAKGREGAILQRDAMRGGAAKSGKLLSAQLQSSQGATERLASSDQNIAAQAANRDRENRIMLNNFNMQNTMMKDRVAQSGQDLEERKQARHENDLSHAGSDIGAGITGAAMYDKMGSMAPRGGGNGDMLNGMGAVTSIPNPSQYSSSPDLMQQQLQMRRWRRNAQSQINQPLAESQNPYGLMYDPYQEQP